MVTQFLLLKLLNTGIKKIPDSNYVLVIVYIHLKSNVICIH